MIIWLSSYPKNGNTWLRALISAYYYSNDGFFLGDQNLQNIQQFPVKKILKVLILIQEKLEIVQDFGFLLKKN